MKKVSFDIPEDFTETWESFLASKGNKTLAEHIRRAIIQFVRMRRQNMLFIKDQDGRLINLARVRFVIDSRRENIPGCFLVLGDLTPEEYRVLRRYLGYPVKGKVAGQDISEMDFQAFEALVEERNLFPIGKVVQVTDMSAAELQGFIEAKLGERVLDVREAASIGRASLQGARE